MVPITRGVKQNKYNYMNKSHYMTSNYRNNTYMPGEKSEMADSWLQTPVVYEHKSPLGFSIEGRKRRKSEANKARKVCPSAVSTNSQRRCGNSRPSFGSNSGGRRRHSFKRSHITGEYAFRLVSEPASP